jgi:RecA/RadA recombinase
MTLSFLKTFKKNLEKLDTASVGLMKPYEWVSTGNYALNYSLSGAFDRGIPLGRITLFAGPSGSGKSFIASNTMAWAQKYKNYHILALDSENALDIEYLRKIGVSTDEDRLTYVQVTTIEDVNSVCSEFFSNYKKTYGKDNPDAPKVLIILDSLAMLASATELVNYDKAGEIKADQGILAKRRKAMLRLIIGNLARLPIGMIITDHVYPADIMLGDGAWAITNSTRFSSSIIGIVTKLKLKEEKTVIGVKMRFETYKSRFAVVGTKIELEVPYNTGMSPFSGLTGLLESMGVIAKGTQPGEKTVYICEVGGERLKFKGDDDLTEELAQKIFKHPLAAPRDPRLEDDTVTEEALEAIEDDEVTATKATVKRGRKLKETQEE